MRTSRRFERRIESLAEMVVFAEATLAGRDVDAGQRVAIDFAIEELFTNMLKYSLSGTNPIEIAFECDAGGVAVTLVDTGVEPFDITAAPEADVDLPLAQRRPGGLGLHLVRRLVDELGYEYRPATRESRIRFRVPSRRPT